MFHRLSVIGGLVLFCALADLSYAQQKEEPAVRLSIDPQHITQDAAINYDYDIVYVRGTRRTDGKEARWAEFSKPTMMELGADLMLLHPDGSEEVLVNGADGSVMDPYVSFDGESVYFTKFVDPQHTGADIYKLHVPTRRMVRLTGQTFTPNTGAANWSADYRTRENGKSSLNYGVFNTGPCPIPGGKVMYTSNRNAHAPPRGYPRYTLQLFLMDDPEFAETAKPASQKPEELPVVGTNVEQVGFLNIACALHPVILRDGRVLFSTLESHGEHNSIMWGVWSIHPDGTNWNPVISAFENGGAPSAYHFQSQLSDGSIIIEKYYNQNQKGFGTLMKLPETLPPGTPGFGPADRQDPRNQVKFVDVNGRERAHAVPFSPTGMEMITPWIDWSDRPSYPTLLKDENSPRIGKVTHPCGAPDNHLLVAWTLGPIGGSSGAVRDYMGPTPMDSGICLIRNGATTWAPGEMLLIKNDPKYNEQWPRPLVSYERLYGVKEPKQLVHKNDGLTHAELPEGTPFGLVGTSSFYKRESAPGGTIPEGSVTAVSLPRTPDSWFWTSWRTNWALQGSDAGVYDNSQIHAVRIVVQEPRTDLTGQGRGGRPLYANHALERLRILGEIPLRKFAADGKQPLDPDGNPDTSFLAKLPADQPFTFQMIDKDGMVLTTAQTWHQLRPGEKRWDCGGCHAHSQQPTEFEQTAAAREDYAIFDLTERTPLLTDKAHDESKRRWDEEDSTGVRYADASVVNVEYFRDIKPIFERSCVACHTHQAKEAPAGLVLDDDHLGTENAFGHDAGPDVPVPLTYFRLAAWKRYTQPRVGEKVGPQAASHYITEFQSRRSLLVWKIYGRRTDGWTNEDFPSITEVGNLQSLRVGDEKVDKVDYNDEKALHDFTRRYNIDQDYRGSIMPPPAAVASGKVEPLTDEDRRIIVRWIDLGCPIDVDPQYQPGEGKTFSYGWMGDDQRPTLALTTPVDGSQKSLDRILIGMADAYTGLDLTTFTVTADCEINGVAAGENLAPHFKALSGNRWELKLAQPFTAPGKHVLTVSIKDKQGNIGRVERTFAIE